MLEARRGANGRKETWAGWKKVGKKVGKSVDFDGGEGVYINKKQGWVGMRVCVCAMESSETWGHFSKARSRMELIRMGRVPFGKLLFTKTRDGQTEVQVL